MKESEHPHTLNQNHDSWLKRHRWINYGALVVIAFYLLTEHKTHVLTYLPYLFLAACPLMHFFMHGGHHHDHKKQELEKNV